MFPNSFSARVAERIVVWGALLFVVVGAIAGATEWRLVQYGILGAFLAAAAQLIGVHSFVEGAVRPARAAIAGDTGVGDLLPRSQPTFAAWSRISVIGVAFGFAVGASLLGAAFNQVSGNPALAVVIGCVAIGFAVPITVGAGFAPSLRPIRDLAEGTERVAARDYSQRLPVVQDDDLGLCRSRQLSEHAQMRGRRASHPATTVEMVDDSVFGRAGSRNRHRGYATELGRLDG